MANLTGTQKKKRNQFVALLVAIVVVLAAIFYVAYSAFMAQSAFLENQDFAAALAMAFDKSARSVSEEDLGEVKYVEIYNDGENASVYLGYEDFVEQYNKYTAEVKAAQEAEEAGEDVPEITAEHPVSLAKYGFFEGSDELAINDVKYFTGAEILSLSNFSIDNASLGQFKNLKKAYFTYCGIDNNGVKALAEGINLEAVEELVFMGNSVDDWSPLQSISDKVKIQNYGFQMTEDGQYTVVPTEQTLTEYLEAQAKAEAEAEAAESEEETAEAEGEEVAEELTEETPEESTEETETAEVTE